MLTSIQKWGNSQGLRIPINILEKVSLKENDKVEISVEDDTIVIKKVVNNYKNLDELFREYQGNYECKENDSGQPIGNEVL